MQQEKKAEMIRVVKYVLFSISAGVIQSLAFMLLHEILHWPYWPCYLAALVLSVLWNFTLNRKFTFQSANNVPRAMLMVAGYDRYYQIVKCFRDEDLRADRQPEFTQVDIETSFMSEQDIRSLFEGMIRGMFKEVLGVELANPFPTMTYADAMHLYGSDKPDLRFGNPLVELTEYFHDTPFRVFQAPYVGAVVFKGGAATPRRQFDAWQDWARQRGAKGLAYVIFAEDGELKGPVAKNLSQEERDGLREAVGRLLRLVA